MAELRENIGDKILPLSVENKINEEMYKLDYLNIQDSNWGITKSYLDLLTKLPYSQTSRDNYNLDIAKKALDQSNFGMENVKQRILEFIAVC